MKITKKIEAEILQVMDEYWGSYFNGDLQTWASFLPDEYKNIGTTKTEIWNSKKEIVDFTEKVLDQTVGMAEVRNKKTQIIPYAPYIMVHELGDLYVKAEEGWIFYAPFRLSSLLDKTTDGWKILHQHGSYPDSKTDEGEAFGFDELRAENKKLRDAIQSRTIELERKNRELEIEAALERVRAKTMAMQKSEELGATSLLLFDALKALGEISEQISIGIFDEENQVLNLYATLHGEQWKEASKVDLDEPHAMQKIYSGWREKKKSIRIDLSGEELTAYNRFRSQYSDLKFPDERWVIHCAFFSKGVFSFSTTTPHDEQTMQLLERFAQVFDGTYTRFLDLQKAETQAREAQIEAALERVRAQTMAMHNSEDVGKCTVKMFSELTALGVDEGTRFGIGILNHDNENNQLWTASKDGQEFKMHIGNLDMTLHPLLRSARKAWKEQVPLHRYVLEGEDLLNYYQALNDAPDYPLRIAMENLPERQFHYGFVFEQGFFYAFCPSEFQPDLIHITHRFSSQFGQTYQRYLDLVKAEGQAREAQIEAALERVRAKTMAMHSSSELLEVVAALYEALNQFGMGDWGCNIMIFNEEKDQIEIWLSESDQRVFSDSFKYQTTGNNFIKKQWEIWRNKSDENISLAGEVKRNYDDYLFNNTDFKNLPTGLKDQIKSLNEIHFSFATMKFGMLAVIDSKKQISENEKTILKRFAMVFEQTYTRFLDLQKAEAQSREAKIEAALERVRAQSMMMQHSDELNTTSNVFHEQLLLLGLPSEFSYVWLPDEANGTHMFWATWSEKQNGTVTSRSKAYTYPLDKTEPYTAACFEMWESDEDVFVNRIQPEEVEGFFSTWSELVGEAESLKAKNFPDGLYYAEAYMKYGCFGINIRRPLNEAEQEVLHRFANEFERTYTRFLDLQKAEEQAHKIKLVNQENQRLLHSILPQPIAEQIRTGQKTVVKRFEQVSILFADIVGFTLLSEKLSPGKVVAILNGLFSKFDDLTDEYGLEKIKTIGDAYMVAAGVPEENADHAKTLFLFAQDMLRSLEQYNSANHSQLNIRIGISSGPVVAGVIGKKKFAYDLWGDSVNTAARMEAYGREGKIQVSPTTYELLKNDFAFEKMPEVNIKGKGVMDVYLWMP